MAIFNSYVKLPEGIDRYSVTLVRRCSARTGGAALVFVKTKKEIAGDQQAGKTFGIF